MSSVGYSQAAIAFLAGQARAFGLGDARAELAPMRTDADGLGRTFVRLQQRHQGVPILGAELSVQLDGARNVFSVNGESVGDLAVSTEPEVAARDALATARRSAARRHRVPVGDLAGSTPSLAIHDARIFGGPAAPPRLVWRVEVTSAEHLEIRELVLVDARNGRVAVQFNQQPHAAPRNGTHRICDANNTASKYPCTPADAVNNPGQSNVADVKNAFEFAENTFDFFARRFNRDSLDGNGLVLTQTVRYCPNSSQCPYANAFWNSANRQMVYGTDYASADDVVGHELGHGFTDFTSNLFYFYQSGAINESLSDIFGELVDQTNGLNGDGGNVKWALAEDLPIPEFRNMEDPTRFNDPDRMTSTLYWGSSNDNGGVHHNSGIGNKTAYLITEPGNKTFNGQTVNGIGIDKSAAIFHRVDALLLGSGSDYADFGNALKQACKDLTGTTPKNSKGRRSRDGNITRANCNQLDNAIAATELFKPSRHNPIPAEAPVCTRGRPTNVLLENFEGAPGQFKFEPSDSNWFLLDFYAASDTHSIDGFLNPSSPGETNLTETALVRVPARAFLRFAHYYDLYPDYSGAVVEYQIGSGTWRRVPQGMFTHNAYNATILADSGGPLEGDRAYSGFSGGWTSSRIDLSSLAGERVRFRFRIGAAAFAFAEWILDDIRIFTCSRNPQISQAAP